jgi:hypothetical protein
MTDHVTRMVSGWLATHRPHERGKTEDRAVVSLVDAIHRLIREAENQARRRYDASARTSDETK